MYNREAARSSAASRNFFAAAGSNVTMNAIDNMKPTDSKSQWATLAVARFTLALVVVSAHLRWVVPNSGNHSWLASGGPLAAVFGFLLISGYSIAHSLRNGSGGYARRRFMRIAPVYWICCLLALLPFLFYGSTIKVQNGITVHPPSWPLFGANLLMLQSFVCPTQITLAPAWTLSIECAFYAVAPFLVRVRTRYLLAVILASAAGNYFWFRSLGPLLEWPWLIWAWVGGFVLYRHRADWRLWATLAPIAVFLAGVDHKDFYMGDFARLTMVLSLVVLAASPYVRMATVAAKFSEWLGDLSYPLYLAHFPVMILLYGALKGTPWNTPAVYITAYILTSAAIFHLVDAPLRKRKKAVVLRHDAAIPHTASIRNEQVNLPHSA